MAQFKKIKRGIMVGLIILGVVVLLGIGYMHLPMFGGNPSKEDYARFSMSTNYKNGKFQDLEETPMMPDGAFKAATKALMPHERLRPKKALPTVKTDLSELSRDEDVMVWFGHSSYFIQIDGKRFLIDPVLSRFSSPVLFYPAPFKGTSVYKAEDIPEIDYVLITHDHWDHLDYGTMKKLKNRVKFVICGLGVGAHLKRWGYTPSQIVEMDWGENFISGNVKIYGTPARHFSGRSFKGNQTLWMSFVVKMPDFMFYVGGDSGYGRHFAEIGKRFGQMDLVMLDSGQFDQSWRYIHMFPDQVIQAAEDLNAKRLFPVHLGKLCIANHPWDMPYIQITEDAAEKPFQVITPEIGEKVYLKEDAQSFTHWWEGRE